MAGPNAGRSGARWRRLRVEQRAKHLPCWLCGQPIDYDAAEGADAFSVDHVLPRSTHPHLAEDPVNLRSAHSRCNKERGARAPHPALGITSEAW